MMRANTFGHSEWEKSTAGLKGVTDALTIRHRILWAFEQAERESGDTATGMTHICDRRRGPTGLEWQAWSLNSRSK